jgi:hypothetical protein
MRPKKRLSQLLEELEGGKLYMNMKGRPGKNQ